MATALAGSVQISAQDVFTSSTVQQHALGAISYTVDGRKFRYVSVQPSSGGATGQPTGATLVAGNVLQSPAQIANHLALTPTAATAIGDTLITVTLGGTAAYANQYANGYVIISAGTGNGLAYLVKSHPAAASSATLTLTLSDAIKVATNTSTSKVDLQANIYDGVIQAPVTTATASTVGVALNPIASNTDGTKNFGWIQSHGVAGCLITGTPAVGAQVVGTGAVAGAAAIASSTLGIIGRMLSTGVDTKNNAVYLTID